MLQNRGLYFCRSDLMGDPFEGYLTRPRTEREDEYVRIMMQRVSKTNPNYSEAQARTTFRNMLQIGPRIRNELFLNCWHMNEEESIAMWKLYASRDNSICIQSTYLRLANLLPEECFLGTVRYINYATDFIDWDNGLNYIVHKRRGFEHERELRAVIWNNANIRGKFALYEGQGLIVPINTDALIESIYVSPDAEPILHEIVEALSRTYGVRGQVYMSRANAPPDY